jgi:hypothetical protein
VIKIFSIQPLVPSITNKTHAAFVNSCIDKRYAIEAKKTHQTLVFKVDRRPVETQEQLDTALDFLRSVNLVERTKTQEELDDLAEYYNKLLNTSRHGCEMIEVTTYNDDKSQEIVFYPSQLNIEQLCEIGSTEAKSLIVRKDKLTAKDLVKLGDELCNGTIFHSETTTITQLMGLIWTKIAFWK